MSKTASYKRRLSVTFFSQSLNSAGSLKGDISYRFLENNNDTPLMLALAHILMLALALALALVLILALALVLTLAALRIKKEPTRPQNTRSSCGSNTM